MRDRVGVGNERVGRRSTAMSRRTRLSATVAALMVASIFGSVGLLPVSVGAVSPSHAQLVAAGKSTSPWKVQKTPNLKESLGSALSDVSCISATSCVAVGDHENSDGDTLTLAEVWNGATWKIQKMPTPTNFGESGGDLSSVSCGSASACAAVGYSGVLNTSFSEVRDGSTWTIQPIPNPAELGASDLYGVSCTSPTSCTAVGYFLSSSFVDTTLAEVWDGAAWTIQTTPSPTGRQTSELLGVSCTSGACTAIGYSELPWATLAEVGNGSTWKLQKIPNQSDQIDKLTGVSCTSATACIAVGSSSKGAFVEAK